MHLDRENPCSIFSLCRRLYMKLINKQPFSPQHSFVRSFDTVHDCVSSSTKSLLAKWTQFKQICYFPKFRLHAKSCVPHVYFLFKKNKSREWDDVVKVRLIYSYFRHPLKTLASWVSKALFNFLSLVVKQLATPRNQNMDTKHTLMWPPRNAPKKVFWNAHPRQEPVSWGPACGRTAHSNGSSKYETTSDTLAWTSKQHIHFRAKSFHYAK